MRDKKAHLIGRQILAGLLLGTSLLAADPSGATTKVEFDSPLESQDQNDGTTIYYPDFDFEGLVDSRAYSIDEVILELVSLAPEDTLRTSDFLGLRCVDPDRHADLDSSVHGSLVMREGATSSGALWVSWHRKSLDEVLLNPFQNGPGRQWFGDDDCWQIRMKTGHSPLAGKVSITYHLPGSLLGELAAQSRLLVLPHDDRTLLDLEMEGLDSPWIGRPVLQRDSIEKLVVVIHGWNPTAAANPFGTPASCSLTDGLGRAYSNLALRLVRATSPEAFPPSSRNQTAALAGWRVARFFWPLEASTGQLGWNESREHAVALGTSLGILLSERPELKFVHFIAHSAGSWVARSAARQLPRERIHSQITALDPFVNDGLIARQRVAGSAPVAAQSPDGHPSFDASGFDFAPAFSLTSAWGHVENYYVDDDGISGNDSCTDTSWWPDIDTGFAGYTSGGFPYWHNFDLDPLPVPCMQSWMGRDHGGPISWYADTVEPSRSYGGDATCELAPYFVHGFGRSESAQEPRIKLTHPAEGDEVAGLWSLKVEAARGSAGNPVTKVGYGCAGNRIGLLDTSSYGANFAREIQLDTRACGSDGLREIFVTAYSPGNRDRTAFVMVDVRNQTAPPPNQAPSQPSGLQQRHSSSQTTILPGSSLLASAIDLSAIATDADSGDRLILEVELQRGGSTFTGQPSESCSPIAAVASGTRASARCSSLVAGGWRWRARTRDASGLVSAWVAFGSGGQQPDFEIQEDLVQWQNGTVYGSTSGDARLCHYLDGRCRLLASSAVYLYFRPGDSSYAQVVRVSPETFATLIETSPCRIGGWYLDTNSPGCVHHDTALAGDAKYFVMGVGGGGERLPSGAIGSCFSSSRVVEVPGIVATGALGINDAGGSPTYCTPGGAAVEDCGDCKLRTSGCDSQTCRTLAGNCSYQCNGSTEICLADRCQSSTAGVSPGTFVSPSCGATVGSGGGTISFQQGSAVGGDGVETGAECRKNQSPFYLFQGFSPTTSNFPMPTLGPDESWECRLLTRRSGYLEPVVTSLPCRWVASGDRAQMEVREVVWRAPPAFPHSCRELAIEAKVANVGGRAMPYYANAWLHPLGGSPESQGAVSARKVWIGGTLDPGAEQTVRLYIDPRSPLPLAPAAMGVTFEAWDSGGHSSPHRRSTTVSDVDEEGPIIGTFRVDAFPGSPPVVLAGRAHIVTAIFSDLYSLANWAVDWRRSGVATWTPVANGSFDPSRCHLTEGAGTVTWTPPLDLPRGAAVELRAQVTDAGGRTSETFLSFVVETTTDPHLAFRAPVDGASFRRPTYENSGCNSLPYPEPSSCLDVELELSPDTSGSLREILIGLVEDNDTGLSERCQNSNNHNIFGLENSAVIRLPSSGPIRTTLRPWVMGANFRVAAVTRDSTETYCLKLGPRIRIDPPALPAPWKPLRLEAGRWDSNDLGSQSRHLRFPRLLNGELVFDENVEYDWRDVSRADECAINIVRYDPETLRRRSVASLVPPTIRAGTSCPSFELHDEELRARLGPGEPLNCQNPYSEPCDVPILYQEVVGNEMGPVREVLYTERTLNSWPWPVGLARLTDGRRLLVIRSYNGETEHSAETDLYVVDSQGVELLRSLPVNVSSRLGVDSLDGRPVIYGYRLSDSGSERTLSVDAIHLSPLSGEILSTEPVFTGPSNDTGYYDIPSSAARPRLVVLNKRMRQLRILERGDEGGWRESVAQTLPERIGDRDLNLDSLWPTFSMSADDRLLLWHWTNSTDERFGVVPLGTTIPFVDGFVGPWKTPRGNVVTFQNSFDEHSFLFPDGHLLYWDTDWYTSGHYFTATDALPATASLCDDRSLCTVDTWDSETGACRHDMAVACADDDDLCNGVPRCAPETGTCEAEAGSMVACSDDADRCNGTPACSPSSGLCIPGDPVDLDDGVGCTVDRCNPTTGNVTHIAENFACHAGPCDISRCAPGEAGHDPISGCVTEARTIEDDGLACTVGTCSPVTGGVTQTVSPQACVADGVCLSVGEQHPNNQCLVCAGAAETPPEAAGFRESSAVSCDDGRYCTVGDTCEDGGCDGRPRSCRVELDVPEDACALVDCDEATDGCELVVLPDGAACTGGDLCKGTGVCVEASCLREAPLDCDDFDPCTRDSCDPERGCRHEGAPKDICDMSWENGFLRVYSSTTGVQFRFKATTSTPLTPGFFANPLVENGGYSACIYGEERLLGRFALDSLDQPCATSPCWHQIWPEGFMYRNDDLSSEGVRFLQLGTSRRGSAMFKVRSAPSLGTSGAVRIAALAHDLAASSEATVQIMVDHGERCFGVTFRDEEIQNLGDWGVRATTGE